MMHQCHHNQTHPHLRLASGEPISVLDGVPIAIKDEIDCMPYPTVIILFASKPLGDGAKFVKKRLNHPGYAPGSNRECGEGSEAHW
ncbi:fatty acid amide hydrolase-like protein [Tanacetum coccineum]